MYKLYITCTISVYRLNPRLCIFPTMQMRYTVCMYLKENYTLKMPSQEYAKTHCLETLTDPGWPFPGLAKSPFGLKSLDVVLTFKMMDWPEDRQSTGYRRTVFYFLSCLDEFKYTLTPTYKHRITTYTYRRRVTTYIKYRRRVISYIKYRRRVTTYISIFIYIHAYSTNTHLHQHAHKYTHTIQGPVCEHFCVCRYRDDMSRCVKKWPEPRPKINNNHYKSALFREKIRSPR